MCLEEKMYNNWSKTGEINSLNSFPFSRDTCERLKKAIFTYKLEYEMMELFYNYSLSEKEMLFIKYSNLRQKKSFVINLMGLTFLKKIQNNPIKKEYFLRVQKQWCDNNILFALIIILGEYDVCDIEKSINLVNFNVQRDNPFILYLICNIVYMNSRNLNLTDNSVVQIYKKLITYDNKNNTLVFVGFLLHVLSYKLYDNNRNFQIRNAKIKEQNVVGDLLELDNFLNFVLTNEILNLDITNIFIDNVSLLGKDSVLEKYALCKDTDIDTYIEICNIFEDLTNEEINLIKGNDINEIIQCINSYRFLNNL